jgi:flagellar motor switch protein FliN
MAEDKKEGQEKAPNAKDTKQTTDSSNQSAQSEEKERHEVKKAHFSPFSSEKKLGKPEKVDFLLDISLELSIELGRSVLTVKDILSLKDGSVVELDKLAGDPVDILVNNKLIARGEVVVIDDNFGVRVTDILSPADLINNLGDDSKNAK